ncbi:hypothetical protein ACNQF7_16020 [Flavobacterium sp. RSP29]
MKKETLQKRVWQKPEIKDLDIDETAGGAVVNVIEALQTAGSAS